MCLRIESPRFLLLSRFHNAGDVENEAAKTQGTFRELEIEGARNGRTASAQLDRCKCLDRATRAVAGSAIVAGAEPAEGLQRAEAVLKMGKSF